VNLLFVCSKNKWRSPTAESIFKNHDFYKVKSAGTSDSARIRISESHIKWADLIFVMEKKHKQIIKEFYADSIEGKEIIILDIEDEYQFMDPELVEIINLSVRPYLKNL
jgi:predicted protein tyrosine phosphatase